jgi:hypothetical protein
MEASPKAAYQSLFFDLQRPTDAAAIAARDYQLRTRRSVLDLVKAGTERLQTRLGDYDRQRFERHLDEIRDLERRLQSAPPEVVGACKAPGAPGEDPAVAGRVGKDASLRPLITESNAWSDEERRAGLMTELLHMALACDLTRVATFMYTMAQSFMSMYKVLGYKSDVHQISHFGAGGPTTRKVSEVVAWHVGHFARLVKRLAETPEGSGTLLDNCAIVLLPEGGGGGTSHTGENMACLLAGRAGGLKAGQHLVAQRRHVSQVLLTLMNAVDVPATRLGVVEGVVPELRG